MHELSERVYSAWIDICKRNALSTHCKLNAIISPNHSPLTHTLQKAPGRNNKIPRTTFSQVLKSSVERETTAKGWCSRCQRYQTIATRKTIHSVPDVLMLNTAIANADHRMLWNTPGWLPDEIGIIVEQGQFFCYEGEDLKLHLQRGIHNITVYSLIGMTISIESSHAQKPHLVAMVNGMILALLDVFLLPP